jgi:hypothetical protein
MAVKEELIIEARAETGDAEQGLARVAKAATALADAEEGIATGGAAASESLDELGSAAAAAEKKLGGAGDSAKEFSDEVERAAKEAGTAKTKFGDAGTEAAKAGDKMSSASSEGKKFTDMLREAGDQADIAFGSMIDGIGGPALVTGLAGAGVAFAGVKAGVEAFVDSSEQLFRSYGPEGQAVWDQTEKKIFAIRGAFAAAVLAGDDLEENARRMNALLDGTKIVVDALLTPLRLLGERLGSIVDLFSLTAENATDAGAATAAYARAVQSDLDVSRQITEVYNQVIASNKNLIFSKKELAAMTLKENIEKIDSLILLEQEQAAHRANSEAELAAATKFAEVTAPRMKAARAEAAAFVASQDPEDIKSGIAQTYTEVLDGIIAEDVEFNRNRELAVREAREYALAEYGVTGDIQKREINRLLDVRENMLQQAAELELPPINPAPVVTPTTGGGVFGGGDPKKEAADIVYAFALAKGGYAELTKAQAETLLASETMLGDSSSRIIEMSREEFTQMDDLAQKLADNDATRAAERAAHYAEGGRLAREELHNAEVAEEERTLLRAEKLKKQIAEFYSELGKSSKALGLQNLDDALAGIGTTLGSAARSGEDFGDAIGATMESLVGQIAGQWGDLFLKQGIGLMFLDPVAGAGLLAAGIGLKALSGFMSGGDSTTDTGSTGASGVQASATTTTVARPEASFGYFEGGRSPVTIVTNDAASIRTMQHRLDFVSARGGSGV